MLSLVNHLKSNYNFLFLALAFIANLFMVANVDSMPVKLFRSEGGHMVPAGTGAVVERGNFVLTTAHLITKNMAECGASVKDQLCELDKIGAVFLSQKVKCNLQNTNINFVDGAILVPNGYFQCETLDPGINPVKICRNISCLDDTYTFSAETGFKEDVLKYLSNRSFRKGDSGSVIATKANNDAIGVFYGHGNTEISRNGYPTSFFFMLDNYPGLLGVIRTSVGKTTVKRMLPPGCKEFKEEI
ncbi:MAG: hypothetical protein SFU25_00545 [Candidatus Caenarcaniphilales bacterium]|nr:hypothetical protein [Candidatus Caenarcaniphilales bacterium]